MTQPHPNAELLSQLNLLDLDASASLFSKDFVWHYINPNLPDLEGDYVGIEGLKDFFGAVAGTTRGTFAVEPISVVPMGPELIVVHVRDTMEFQGNPIALDAAVVWRIVDGQIAEAWDIPSAYALATE